VYESTEVVYKKNGKPPEWIQEKFFDTQGLDTIKEFCEEADLDEEVFPTDALIDYFDLYKEPSESLYRILKYIEAEAHQRGWW
jgi:hypothetical protein